MPSFSLQLDKKIILKIFFTQDAVVNAGAERSHLEILSRFSDQIDVSMVYFYPKHELRKEYQRAGIRLFFLDIPEPYHFGLAVFRLVKLIRREKPDLLVSCLWRADMITRMASWVTGVPLVGTLVNDSYSSLAWKDKVGLKYKLVYWLDRWTAKIPVHWIANARALVESHHRTLGLSPNKVTVVYRGREIPVLRSVPARPSGESPQTGISGSSPGSVSPQTGITGSTLSSQTGIPIRNFISYGRLLERKGFQDAIQAFAKVIPSHPDCTLTIFGEGPYRKELEKLIEDLELQNSVFLPGKISNPMELLLNGYCPLPTAHCPLFAAHCFLFPSWYEGFSGALVEAMMAGMPIIASDIPMNLEAVEDQKSALIFPVGDIEHLEEKMRHAIEHPTWMESLGQEARKIAVQKFDIELIAKQYENTLKEIFQKIK